MKVLLLANQPEKTTRLKLFGKTLESQGHEVVVPFYGTRNWITIAMRVKQAVKKERPDAVHLFNVPDLIYHGLPKLKGPYFRHLIYDYRSPWAIETGITFGPLARKICEGFENELAEGADILTSPNEPMGRKVSSYPGGSNKPLFIVPNYPPKKFQTYADTEDRAERPKEDEGAIIFVGRISRQEGIGNLLRLARKMPEERFWIVGDGPFARFYLRNMPKNVRFFGWQPQQKVAELVSRARICLIIPDETEITPYATEKSIWKLNQYLSLGKIVIATGISPEEKRKNLFVVNPEEMEQAIRNYKDSKPEKLTGQDKHCWEQNDSTIRQIYERLEG
ncbi:Glycosyl transferases group 1 [uncultured archaeon]|nr:Glycosyl transferases group 1 [uncultured archaeon]